MSRSTDREYREHELGSYDSILYARRAKVFNRTLSLVSISCDDLLSSEPRCLSTPHLTSENLPQCRCSTTHKETVGLSYNEALNRRTLSLLPCQRCPSLLVFPEEHMPIIQDATLGITFGLRSFVNC